VVLIELKVPNFAKETDFLCSYIKWQDDAGSLLQRVRSIGPHCEQDIVQKHSLLPERHFPLETPGVVASWKLASAPQQCAHIGLIFLQISDKI
jgi:hypothetical protein